MTPALHIKMWDVRKAPRRIVLHKHDQVLLPKLMGGHISVQSGQLISRHKLKYPQSDAGWRSRASNVAAVRLFRLYHSLSALYCVCVCVVCRIESQPGFQLSACSLTVCVCVLSLLSTLLPAQNGQIHSDWNKKAAPSTAAPARSLQPGFHRTGGIADPTTTTTYPTSAPVPSDHISETHERVRTHFNSSGERQHERPRCH